MDNVSANLREGERVIATGKQHIGAVIVPIVVMAIGALIVFTDFGPAEGWFQALGALVLALGVWKTVASIINYTRTSLTLTDQRIFGESGFMPHKTMTLSLNEVDSVDAKRDIFGSLLGYGTVVVNATGRGNLRVLYPQIVNAEGLATAFRAQMALPTVSPTAPRDRA
jgi:uncharacterized membrane protein YdbT with pleckstrin-like domain